MSWDLDARGLVQAGQVGAEKEATRARLLQQGSNHDGEKSGVGQIAFNRNQYFAGTKIVAHVDSNAFVCASDAQWLGGKPATACDCVILRCSSERIRPGRELANGDQFGDNGFGRADHDGMIRSCADLPAQLEAKAPERWIYI